jgi:hypothetical protein
MACLNSLQVNVPLKAAIGKVGSQLMMTTREIFRYLRAEPFRPFRINMASGRTFEIRHPEMVRVGRNDLVVFSLVSDEPEIHDDWDTVSLVLIESISHLDAATSKS